MIGLYDFYTIDERKAIHRECLIEEYDFSWMRMGGKCWDLEKDWMNEKWLSGRDGTPQKLPKERRDFCGVKASTRRRKRHEADGSPQNPNRIGYIKWSI